MVHPARFSGHFAEQGKGPAVLCLSGFGSSNWLFHEMALDLADSFRFIMPDNRGMGRSAPALGRYEIEDLADDALALAEDLGLERFAVLGISMGGFIAQSMALRCDKRLAGLVLLCTMGPGPEFLPPSPLKADQVRAFYALHGRAQAEASLALTTHPGLRERDPHRYDRLLRLREANLAELDQVLLQLQAVERFLKRPHELSRIHCPTLIMAGEGDRFVPPDNATRLAERIPHAQRVMVPDSDHLFFLERPELVHRPIRRFLEDL
jgi:pimeloyl-ACP methyl ester carboxylesterase